MHKLFDTGYITIAKNYTIEISKRIAAEFQNGKEYYKYQGKVLTSLPFKEANRPDQTYIEWHNNIFKG
jgi:predicted restriction endonuclease